MAAKRTTDETGLVPAARGVPDDAAMRDVVRWIDRKERVEVEAALRSHSGFDGSVALS
jgi:hypothetical protein